MIRRHLLSLVLLAALAHLSVAGVPAHFKIAGDWEVVVSVEEPQQLTANVRVTPPLLVTVAAEKYDRLPLFKPNAPGWTKGAQLRGVQAQETTTPGLLDPESLTLRAGLAADSTVFQRGKDYEVDGHWGTIGRTADSGIRPDEPVFVSYRHAQLRLDSVVLTAGGTIVVRPGQPRAAAPVPPPIEGTERLLGNIWLAGRVSRLASDNLFPILESAYPEPVKTRPTAAERLAPKAMQKLRAGEHLRVLAWGDSVTDGSFLADWQHNRWQEQFVRRLRARFPAAQIELVTEAWGGRNTSSYLNEPAGSPHNYREKVLGARPDLIISEFVNDAGLSPQQVEERYGKLLGDFQSVNAEWIVLTPHYVRPDWMGLTREREIDGDPRPYVAGLRAFGAKHGVALGEASLRYGRLWRQGLPYTSLLLNSINHPDARGMKLFADALMELFP